MSYQMTDGRDPGPMPAHLLDVPGLIGDVMRFNLATAFRPQPVLALGAAICLQAVLAGRKVRDGRNTRTNILAIGVAPSGMGKDHGRQINAQCLLDGGASSLCGPEELASDAGLVAALERNPATLFQIDEFGRMLRAIETARGMPHLKGIVTTFLKLYSSAGVPWNTKAYADAEKNKVILQPHAVLWGTTARSHLVESLTREQMSDGFMARLLVFEGDANPGFQFEAADQITPDEVIERVRWWSAFQPDGNLSSVNLHPATVPTTGKGAEIMKQFLLHCDELRTASADAESVASIWARGQQKAAQLALCYACSRDHMDIVIDEDAARWAIDLVAYLHRRMIFLADGYVAENAYESKQKRIERLLRNAGGQMQRAEVCRATRDWTPRERDEVISGMLAIGVLKIVEVRTGGRPRIDLVLNSDHQLPDRGEK
jgi:hypothetical protein